MKIENAPYDALVMWNTLLDRAQDKVYSETGLVDLDEMNLVSFAIEKEIEKRKTEAKKISKEGVEGHFYIAKGYGVYYLFEVTNASKNSKGECAFNLFTYDMDEETVSYEEAYEGYLPMLSIDKDMRICVTFHDDEDGSCYAKEISKELYEKIIDTPARKMSENIIPEEYRYFESF